MFNNYDNIAGSYDFLSKLIFGDKLVKAQTCLIPFIQANSTVLIVGGGTGWLLEEISQFHRQGLRIVYIEISAAMIVQSKKRDYQQNEVVFINQPIENFTTDEHFDIIFTPFLFDNFAQERSESVVALLSQFLKKNGAWLFVDFYLSAHAPVWQKLLLETMIRFFKLICNIESHELIPMEPVFSQHNYQIVSQFYHCKKFIKSVVYQPLA